MWAHEFHIRCLPQLDLVFKIPESQDFYLEFKFKKLPITVMSSCLAVTSLTGHRRHSNADLLWKKSCLRLKYQDQSYEGYIKVHNCSLSSESLCLALDLKKKKPQFFFLVSVINAWKWSKCYISEIYVDQEQRKDRPAHIPLYSNSWHS